ncbi:methylated-DNA--[protein]-cysteine S-methyltransferase [Helicovermis profundi]|uniref:Methylated-DNA--protein-cysteine methyltransferase n=1 Tax=Helicovermis profundi TaxID=3065157 RepID=A0AAU9E2K1_9FIRM|nr:methylated-DNA--[protein]-cysteine S-methyltransferase [Clostridia bacterium S502]
MNNCYIAYYNSPIGIVKIVTNKEAITSVGFVDVGNPSDLSENEMPEILLKAVTQLDEYFNGERKLFDLNYELKGTSFQLKVWNALMNIEFGKTCSYKDIAIEIGNSKAMRAVGGANNKNPIGIMIPCHRVIGANKKLIGYAGGLDKKQWLLNHEKRYI